MRYTLSSTSHALLNAILAISQLFMADVHVRLAVIKEVEDEVRYDDGDTNDDGTNNDGINNDVEEDAQLMLASQWQERAKLAIVQGNRCDNDISKGKFCL
eukprot:IDg1908t1